MSFVAAGLSDVGLQREHNEDSYCIRSNHRLFIVADGMGGHRAGDVASRLATSEIATFFDTTDGLNGQASDLPIELDARLTAEQNRLVAAVKAANRRIFQASVQNQEVQGMGTTVVGALFTPEDHKIHVVHVGDSRAYRVRDGEIAQLTRDHSLLNDYLLVMPNLTDQQKDRLPTNVITRALGMQEGVAVDLYCESVEVGDTYVLCSDGLNGMLSDDRILSVVQEADGDLESAAKGLIASANDRGGEDNITVVLLRIVA